MKLLQDAGATIHEGDVADYDSLVRACEVYPDMAFQTIEQAFTETGLSRSAALLVTGA
jgi:hypothetical protein